MEIETKVRYHYKDNLYYIEITDPRTETKVTHSKMYEYRAEAMIAADILHCMFFNYSSMAEFDSNKFESCVKSVFNLLDKLEVRMNSSQLN